MQEATQAKSHEKGKPVLTARDFIAQYPIGSEVIHLMTGVRCIIVGGKIYQDPELYSTVLVESDDDRLMASLTFDFRDFTSSEGFSDSLQRKD